MVAASVPSGVGLEAVAGGGGVELDVGIDVRSVTVTFQGEFTEVRVEAPKMFQVVASGEPTLITGQAIPENVTLTGKGRELVIDIPPGGQGQTWKSSSPTASWSLLSSSWRSRAADGRLPGWSGTNWIMLTVI